jgi:hypothetical protein
MIGSGGRKCVTHCNTGFAAGIVQGYFLSFDGKGKPLGPVADYFCSPLDTQG